jgi:hypothetical protein
MEQQHQQPQIYDATLKSFFGDEVADILPALIPGVEFVSECNIELDRTIIKPDLVYLGRLAGELCIINMELQSNEDTMMELRLLLYHAALLYKHKLPVVSVILYPFETNYPVPPYREQSGDNTLLTFNYREYLLWTKDASVYVQQHRVCLYTLLPGMQNATVPRLKQALREMRQYYTTDKRFGDHLVRFQTIMWRSTTMNESEKREMEEELKMIYNIDQFIDGNPRVEQRVAQGIEQGIEQGMAQGMAQGRVEGMQRLMLDVIKDRFPALANQAQPHIEQIRDADTLETLFRRLIAATTEKDVRQILQIQESQ